MNKAQYLVGKGFPAGLAEMEINIKGRTANGLTISGGGTSGAGEALPPAITGRGMALPSLLVLSLPSGAGMVLVIVMLGS